MKRLLLLGLFSFLAGSSVACGGKSVTDGESTGANKAAQQGGKADKGQAATSSPPAPDCVHEHASGSSGGGPGYASCETTDHYQCKAGDRAITCSCSAKNGGPWGEGKCRCGDVEFAIDCANACSIRAEDYAQCNLPAPPEEPSSGCAGSSSTSSGGSTSSSGCGGSSGVHSGSSGSTSSSSGS